MDMKFLIVLVLFALLKQAGAANYAGTDPPLCDDCGGNCDSGECLCTTDSVTLCVPTSSCINNDNTCCSAVTGYYWDSSASKCTDEFRCSPACAIDEVCVKKGLVAVCECNTNAYVGKTIADFKPTVECEHGTMTTSVSICLLTYLGYDHNSLHIRDDSVECSYHYPTTHNDLRIETNQVKAVAGWCNNTHMVIDSQVYYTNTLHIDPIRKVLITKNPIEFDFTCGYNLTMQTSLEFALHPVINTTILVPLTGGGSFSVTMAAYKNTDYTIYEDGESVEVGKDIYLGIFTLDADATNFTLRVDTCFATPSNDPNDPTSIPLVSGGCAITEEVDTEILENGVSLEARIRIKAFQFQNSPTNLFIFCQVSLCPKSDECSKCLNGNGRSLNGNSAQLGVGFTVEDNTFSSNSGSHKAFSYVVMAASLIAFLCMNFF